MMDGNVFSDELFGRTYFGKENKYVGILYLIIIVF